MLSAVWDGIPLWIGRWGWHLVWGGHVLSLARDVPTLGRIMEGMCSHTHRMLVTTYSTLRAGSDGTQLALLASRCP
eukprot:scaffold141165_cov30-Tisochrysis_lutea.AAC.6